MSIKQMQRQLALMHTWATHKPCHMRYNVNLCVAYHNTFHAHMTAFRLQPFGDATDPWPAAA